MKWGVAMWTLIYGGVTILVWAVADAFAARRYCAEDEARLAALRLTHQRPSRPERTAAVSGCRWCGRPRCQEHDDLERLLAEHHDPDLSC